MNLLSSDDLSEKQMLEVFSISDKLESGKLKKPIKEHLVLALLFSEPSTRTRVSFEVAMAQLGGSAIYISTQTSQMKRGETLDDTAKVISGYCDFIAVRTDEHEDVLTIARSSSVPVINALTHLEHPTQALADVYTIMKHKGKIKGLKIAFVGDIAQNTANSLMLTAAKLGATVALVGPKGCTPNKWFYDKSRQYGKVEVYDSVKEGVKGADVIYTDTFVSMGDEASAEQRRKFFAPYQVNKSMLAMAKSDVIVMHPLPAHRGDEISAEVLDGKSSVVWDQAKSKLRIEKALIVYLSRN
jgi:ornithine carbamoyltransferase